MIMIFRLHFMPQSQLIPHIIFFVMLIHLQILTIDAAYTIQFIIVPK